MLFDSLQNDWTISSINNIDHWFTNVIHLSSIQSLIYSLFTIFHSFLSNLMTLSSSSSIRSTPPSPLAVSNLKPPQPIKSRLSRSGSSGHNDSDIKGPWYIEWMIMPKLLYFFLNVVIYSTHSLGPQYFVKEFGFADYQVSYISAFTGFNFIGAIVWSWLADRTGKHKLILMATSLCYALTFSALLKDPFYKYGQERLRFIYTCVIYTLANFFNSALFPLLDANIMATMANNPKFTKENFGRQRLFGSLGHTASTVLAAVLVEKYFGFPGMFGLLCLSAIIFSVLVWFGIEGRVEPGMTGHGHHGHGGGGESKNPSVGLKDTLPNSPTPSPPDIHGQMQTDTRVSVKNPVWILVTSGNFMFFMFFVLIAGIGRSAMTNYQTYFLLNNLDQTAIDGAITTFFRLIFEISVFFFGKKLMHAVGIYWLLILSQIAGIARIAGYALLSPEYSWAYYATFGLETIKGLNSGLFSLSAIRIASDLAPKGCENSAQGLFSGNYSGLSMAAGGIIGGILLWIQNPNAADRMQTMFWWVTLITGFFTGLFTLIYGVQGNLKISMLSKVKATEEKVKKSSENTENP